MIPRLVLYHRPGCHLCEQMLAALRNAYGDEVDVYLIDVDTDTALQQRFGLRVPVLAAEDEVLCETRLDGARLDAYFSRCRDRPAAGEPL